MDCKSTNCNLCKTKSYCKEYCKSYYKNIQEYKDKQKEKAKEYRKNNRGVMYIRSIMKKYNLSKEDYDQIIFKQNNLCPICKSNLSNLKKNVDHDHTTGKVRGILCNICNTQLGVVEKLNKYDERVKRYLGGVI